MNNIKPLMKRVCAYIIDLFIVLLVSSSLSSIELLNKNIDKYQETYDSYEEEYNEYSKFITSLEESYQDNKVDEEEYKELIKSEKYQDFITSKYDDNKISKGEYKEIVKEINQDFDSIANNYVYILNKQGISNTIITLICTLIYFGIIQYFLKGQTIGKKLLKLKVVPVSDKKINIINYLLRSLIVNEVLINSLNVIFLLSVSKKVYTQIDNILGLILSIIEAIIIFLVLTREDGRGLHDLICNTKVISTETLKTNKETKTLKEEKIIEASYEEKSKTKKK